MFTLHKVHAQRFTKRVNFLKSNQLYQFVQIESLAVTFHSPRKQKLHVKEHMFTNKQVKSVKR